MNTLTLEDTSDKRKSILVISASLYLVNEPIEHTIRVDWAKNQVARDASHKFDNVGYQFDPGNADTALQELQRALDSRTWDGFLVGWCLRGHTVEFTEIFERIVEALVEYRVRQPEGVKIMFSRGPDNLVETVLRNFAL
jgi:hypothetical protein